jgi:hypothetical protein
MVKEHFNYSTALQVSVPTFVIVQSNSSSNGGYLTRIAGKSFIEYFRQNQQWGDGGLPKCAQHVSVNRGMNL